MYNFRMRILFLIIYLTIDFNISNNRTRYKIIQEIEEHNKKENK